jgi:hypothetical protein
MSIPSLSRRTKSTLPGHVNWLALDDPALRCGNITEPRPRPSLTMRISRPLTPPARPVMVQVEEVWTVKKFVSERMEAQLFVTPEPLKEPWFLVWPNM